MAAAETQAAETRFRVMASEAHVVVVDGPDQAGEVARRASAQLERAWSRFLPKSDISRLNNLPNRRVVVNEPTITLVESMVAAWEMTNGRYDPSILPALLNAGYRASIDDREFFTRLPASAGSGPGNVSEIIVDRTNRTVRMPYGMALDPGGIGKGLAADLVVAELLARGAAGALVSIGGDLAAAGTPPSEAGWAVAVENPNNPSARIVELAFSGGGVATSSTLSRRWMQGNTERHHLIDPAAGVMAATDLVAVTILASAGWVAEAHATAAILGGGEHFLAYADRFGLEGVALTADGRTLATRALSALRRMATA